MNNLTLLFGYRLFTRVYLCSYIYLSKDENFIVLCVSENNVLLRITINPLNPFACPEFDLIGGEDATRQYRKSIEINLKVIQFVI